MKSHALFLSCLVEAFERRKVVIVDILGALLSTNWPVDASDCYVRFEGVMVEMIRQIKPEYRKLIRHTKKRNGGMREVLVGKVTKAIDGTLIGVVLFYNKLKRGPHQDGIHNE